MFCLVRSKIRRRNEEEEEKKNHEIQSADHNSRKKENKTVEEEETSPPLCPAPPWPEKQQLSTQPTGETSSLPLALSTFLLTYIDSIEIKVIFSTP